MLLTWHKISPATKVSPTLTFHSVRVPSVIVGDIAGMLSADVARTTAERDTDSQVGFSLAVGQARSTISDEVAYCAERQAEQP